MIGLIRRTEKMQRQFDSAPLCQGFHPFSMLSVCLRAVPDGATKKGNVQDTLTRFESRRMMRSGWSNQRQQEQTADSPERRAHAVLAQ